VASSKFVCPKSCVFLGVHVVINYTTNFREDRGRFVLFLSIMQLLGSMKIDREREIGGLIMQGGSIQCSEVRNHVDFSVVSQIQIFTKEIPWIQ
jgi:hypothetical protein